MLKGVAILLMLFHHFFGVYHVDSDVTRPARGEWAFTAMADFAWEAKVCVALFAFVTGYGYFATAGRDAGGALMSGVRRLRRFFPFFVAFCLLHIVLCFCFPFHHQLDIAHIPHYLLTMVGLLSAAPDYWYICIVIMGALLFYPLLLSAQRRGDKLHMIAFVGLALLTVPQISNEVCTLILSCFVEDAEEVFNYILSRSLYHAALPWMCYFLAGWAAAAVSLRFCRSSVVLLVISVILLFATTSRFPFWIGSFFSVLLLVYILQRVPGRWVRPLVLLGNYSACMWLNHRLIFGYWFAGWFYGLPTPLNFGLLVVLSFVLSVLITKAWNGGLKYLSRRG